VEAIRYQGEEVAQAEMELRWQFWKRISLVGLGGLGSAWNDLGDFSNEETVTTYGAGVRYEIARRYGLHMGADVAFGPDDPILYIQFGSAWMRP
jgi:glucose/arabinose dehydrogenase